MINIDFGDILRYKKIPNGDSGRTAICYFYDDKTVIKIFFDFIEVTHSYLPELVNYTNDSIALPLELVNMDGQLSGHTMEYVNGEQLKKISLDYPLDKLITGYEKAYEDIEKASKDGIAFRDFHDGNLILGDKIFIADAARFQVVKPSDFITVYNLEAFNSLISNKLLKLNRASVSRINDKISNYSLFSCDSILPVLKEIKRIVELTQEKEATLGSIKKLKLSQIRKI